MQPEQLPTPPPWGLRQRLSDPRIWAIGGILLIAALGLAIVGGLPLWLALIAEAIAFAVCVLMLPRWADQQHNVGYGARVIVLAGLPAVATGLLFIALVK